MSQTMSASGPRHGTGEYGRKALINTVRFPLQLSIAVVFTVLIVTLGVSLIWYNYAKNRALAFVAAEDLFTRITSHTATNIRELYAPTESLIDLTAQLEAMEGRTLSQRLGLLKYFAQALRNDKRLTSLYVGYENGEFFLVRMLRGEGKIHEAFDAPDNASFMVQSIEIQAGHARQTLLYYDKDLMSLGSSESTATDYDPRQRQWYQLANQSALQIGTGFYVYSKTQEIGTTIARRTPNGKGVVGGDLTLHDISVGIAEQRVTPATEIVVFSEDGEALAYTGELVELRGAESEGKADLKRLQINELANPVFAEIYRIYGSGMTQGQLRLRVNEREWMGSISPLAVRTGEAFYLAILVPQDELLADINELRTKSVLISLALLLLAILIGWWISSRIAQSLRTLASEAERIQELKLDTPITVRSHILEVDDLAVTMAVMKSAVQQFISISKALSSEKDFARLLETILAEARVVCAADGGGIGLLNEDEQTLEFALVHNDRSSIHYGGQGTPAVPYAAIPVREGQHWTSGGSVEEHTVRSGEIVAVDDLDSDERFDFSHARRRYEQNSYRCRSLLYLPLRNRQGEIMGVLELVNARHKASDRLVAFRPEVVSYVAALSSQAAIVLDNQRLLKAQKDLLDSLVQLIAGAIDAKSPYTSGHCQRVPVLARKLAEAAHKSDMEPFRDFSLTEDEWYELHMASWLHDCGKVTTPEYVVDKATKLECIYNRIHEIRMRFEVLWRDAQLSHYKAFAEEYKEDASSKRRLDKRLKQLREDYAFVAECNIGGEYMAEERRERLKAIGAQSWLRYFDDRLGLSHEEFTRKQRMPRSELPATESLLADKKEHIVSRGDDGNPFGDNPYGFKMDVPQHEFNYGELYNLSIARGTLNDEDRFKINDHIIQTIVLLNKLPFPKELRRVPEWAGSHHEKLDGKGYPRRLSAEDLGIPDRIMAIADIFEALTASDRPYKKAKSLSESIRIMSFMRNDNHICPQLFELFLSSGVYLDYAREYLSPEQIDDVEISQYLSQR